MKNPFEMAKEKKLTQEELDDIEDADDEEFSDDELGLIEV